MKHRTDARLAQSVFEIVVNETSQSAERHSIQTQQANITSFSVFKTFIFDAALHRCLDWLTQFLSFLSMKPLKVQNAIASKRNITSFCVFKTFIFDAASQMLHLLNQ